MPNPTVSVLLPNYNDARYIEEALRSHCEQTYEQKEVIVVDDGSTDNSVELIELFASKYPFVKFVRNEVNRGISYSMNRAAGLASGDYLYFGSANDFVLPEFLQKSMSLLARYPYAGLCCGDCLVVDADGRETGIESAKWLSSPGYLSPEQLAQVTRRANVNAQPHTSTCIVRRDLVPQHVYNPLLGFATDWFLNQVIVFRYGCCYVPDVLTARRWIGGGLGYNTMNNPDREPYKKVVAELVRLFSSPGYEDVTQLIIRGRSMRIFHSDVRTPAMVLGAVAGVSKRSAQAAPLLWHLSAEYIVEMFQAQLVSVRQRIRTLTPTVARAAKDMITSTVCWTKNLWDRAYANSFHQYDRARAIIRKRLTAGSGNDGQ